MLKEFLPVVLSGSSLSRSQAKQAMTEVISGITPSDQIAALMSAITVRGETLDEMVGFATAIRQHAIPLPGLPPSIYSHIIDTSGTGGDGAGTFNISTAVAFLVAASGIGVAKHGNRAVSSRCGSADVLESLGIGVDHSPEQIVEMIQELHFGFLFAPRFHPAFKKVESVRRSLGVRTFFNLLGPLLNPAKVSRQILGVYDPQKIPLLAETLQELGTQEAMIVSGADRLDELSLSGPSHVAHLKNGQIRQFTLYPESLGFKLAPRHLLSGGNAEENASIILKIFANEERGPRRDAVVLNGAAALLVGGRVESLSEGVQISNQILDSGAALDQLDRIRKFSSGPRSARSLC